MVEFQEQSTSTAILKFLKINGSSEVKAIAAFCGLTTMGVRRHLQKLLADGLLQVRTERRSQGRPTCVYSVTDLGDAQFPRNYAGLADEVLSSLLLLDGKAKIKAVFRKRRLTMLARYQARTKGKGLEKRVHETATVLTENGYMAETEHLGSGCFLLTEHNCAIRDVARCFPVACEEELCFIRNLIGGKVTRVSHVLAGERNCSYRIERSVQQEPVARRKKV
jgi:DeoR family transcriptional regulator, suf operon transcriptional repressor